jgi:hypothetical protein
MLRSDRPGALRSAEDLFARLGGDEFARLRSTLRMFQRQA